jgi:hypothetical protein
MAQGHANGLQGLAAAVARSLGIGHGDAHGPGIAHGGGKGAGRGTGLGFGHASLENPTLGSHSRNTSHKGETQDGRSFSNHAQDHTDPSKKADQIMQVDDRGPGKEKGFVDSLPPSQEQQADRGITLTAETIYSDPDDIATRGLSPKRFLELEADTQQLSQEIKLLKERIDLLIRQSLEVKLHSGESLSTNWQADVAPGAIVSDTSRAALSRRWMVSDGRIKRLASTNPAPGGDDEGNLWWKLVPCFGAALFILSWIVKSGLAARKCKAAWLELGSVNGPREFTLKDQFVHSGARPPALDKIAAAFSTAGERRQKAVDEKRGASLEPLSGDPDVEKARAQSGHTQEIEQTFHKDFDGIGLG